MAIASLILGLLAFPLTILAGIPAVILGILSVVKINYFPERHAGKGFAITGIVTGCLFSFFIPVLIPSLSFHHPTGRSVCAANITGILKACVVYAEDNNGAFPVTVGSTGERGTASYSLWPGSSAPTYGITDRARLYANKSDADPGPPIAYAAPNNNPAACLWILVLQDRISPKQLLCRNPYSPRGDPFAEVAPSPLTDERGNYYQFPQKPGHSSYSIAYPWNTKGPGAAPYWKSTLDETVPLMSDMALRQAPGDGIAAAAVHSGNKINSSNHEGYGQNVGYGDAHIDWQRTPLVGQTKNDSIFHWGGYDSVTTEFGPDQKQSSTGITLSEPPSGYDIFMVPQRDATGKMW